MSEHGSDDLRILAPVEMKAKFDSVHRQLERMTGRRISRREALGLGGMALLAAAAAACGSTTTTGAAASQGASKSNSLAGKPLESKLNIFNWTDYDPASSYSGFMAIHPTVAVSKTYYSSNDELLAKVNAGGSTYDIIVPSQGGVEELIQEGKLLALDKTLIPNLAGLTPSFLTPSYDPTGAYHVVKDVGVTMFFYLNTVVTDQPKTWLDFYNLLPKYAKKARTNLLEGASEAVPLALMALGLDPNTTNSADYDKVKSFLLSIRSGVTTIDTGGYVTDAMAGKIALGQGYNGDLRAISQSRAKQGDIVAVYPQGTSEIWADNWCIPANAPHPVAAHAWINWMLDPKAAATDMKWTGYKIPMEAALSQLPTAMTNDPLFNVPQTYLDSYKYVLNVSPAVVQSRTQVYTEFKAA